MFDWYCGFYAAAPNSPAHAAFCERVYGRDLCQHGFADMAQLARLLEVLELRPGDRVLDLGCGNGRIAEHISDATGARVCGIDYVPEAIRQATERTVGKRDRLTFLVGSFDALDLPPESFDAVVAIDTLYFSDLGETIGLLKSLLRPGGQIAAYYSIALRDHSGRSPEILDAGRTPLAEALASHGLQYQAWDFTAADYAHARLRQRVLAELEGQFAAESNLFLYENRLGEARGCARAIEEHTHRRYLYLARASQDPKPL